MKLIDPNKPKREIERRFLHKHKWLAVIALKKNGSRVWKWIHPKFKRAYNRYEAVEITKKW